MLVIFKLVLSAINQSRSFPISHYENQFPILQQPSRILVPGLGFVSNGLPYQITVNAKKMEPQPFSIPAYVLSPVNSPVTWISGSWGLNGRPFNMQGWSGSKSQSWGPVHLG